MSNLSIPLRDLKKKYSKQFSTSGFTISFFNVSGQFLSFVIINSFLLLSNVSRQILTWKHDRIGSESFGC